MTAFVGFMHTKAGRPILMSLAGFAGCPMGKASAAEVEAVRRAAVASERGTAGAPARPALGFVLDRTTLSDVRKWAEQVGAGCTEERQGTLVKCSGVAATAIGRPSWENAMTELSFGFSTQGPLVSLTTLYSHRSADDTAKIATDAGATLEKDLGPAHTVAGSLAQTGSVATLSYRFRDYAADVTACPVPGSGFVVRELYASLL